MKTEDRRADVKSSGRRPPKKLILGVLAAALVLVVLTVSIPYTPRIRTKNGIAEIRRFDINGWSNWALIRGEDRISNPLLIIIHGGPGMPANGFLRMRNSILERYYTVVYWEQRGAGYSWDPRLRREDMTVEAFVSDLHELILDVKAELGADPPVNLLAFSWGTIVGMKFVQRYPEMVARYIGVGQVTNDARAEAVSRDWTMAKARAAGDEKALQALRDIGPPPYDYARLLVKSDWARRYGAYSPKKIESVVSKYLRMLRVPEYPWPYLIKLSKGAYFSLEALQDEIARTDLFTEIPEVSVPVIFLEGREDYAVPSSLAEEYYRALKAPKKDFRWFEGCGHSVQSDDPEAFNRALIELRG